MGEDRGAGCVIFTVYLFFEDNKNGKSKTIAVIEKVYIR
jgi:hypothetical protein